MPMLYETNNDFKEYVDKYSAKHHVEPAEALTHLIVQAVALIYECVDLKKYDEGLFNVGRKKKS